MSEKTKSELEDLLEELKEKENELEQYIFLLRNFALACAFFLFAQLAFQIRPATFVVASFSDHKYVWLLTLLLFVKPYLFSGRRIFLRSFLEFIGFLPAMMFTFGFIDLLLIFPFDWSEGLLALKSFLQGLFGDK